MEEFIKIIFSVIASIFTLIFGGWDLLAQILVILMIVDYITGVVRSAKQGGLSSEVGFKGILKKVLMLAIVAVGVLIDRGLNVDGAIRTMVLWYYIANEALSILENVGEMGVPIPKKLQQMIQNLEKKNDESTDEEPGTDGSTQAS